MPRSRVLIKLAGTWAGVRAAEAIERDGIRTNITLVFGFAQAVAAAQAKATLISPFPGRGAFPHPWFCVCVCASECSAVISQLSRRPRPRQPSSRRSPAAVRCQ